MKPARITKKARKDVPEEEIIMERNSSGEVRYYFDADRRCRGEFHIKSTAERRGGSK